MYGDRAPLSARPMDTAPFPAAADERLLDALEKAFARHAARAEHIGVEQLKAALGLRSDYLARRVLSVFDRNGDGVIDRDEFMDGVRALVFGSDRDKLFFAFRLHDHDGDGAISELEMRRMIAISMAESDVAEKASQPSEWLAHTLFAAFDADRDGKLSFDEFAAAIAKHPDLLRRMTRSEAAWIAPNEDLLAHFGTDGKTALEGHGLEGGFARAGFVAGWALSNVAVFVAAFVTTENTSLPMQLGSALGTTLDFDAALVVVPMMRRLLTRIRPTWLGRVVPIDDAVGFHRIVGHTLFALSLGHAAAMTVAYLSGHPRSSAPYLFFQTDRGLTGFVLLCVLFVMWGFALGVVRASRHFELFYFTHLLYVVWFVILVLHAPSFVFWGALPLLGFAIEQIARLRRRGVPTTVKQIEALRSGVTRLTLARPASFTFSAADYVFLRIPAVARREWHPFTISSAPETEDVVLHVRSLGNWSGAVRRLAEEREARRPPEPMVAYVDGPYGTPSAGIFGSRYAVLVGAGIGVTPFASVLDSLVRRANGQGPKVALAKAYFFWLNRDQYSFEWFRALLVDIEAADIRGLLDIHLCMTGARAGATALGLELSREVVHDSGRSDLITGLRTHTHVGAPDWPALLGDIARRHQPEKVDVYFCGPRGLARKLRQVCTELAMRFHEERF